MSNNKRTVRITPTEHKPHETMAIIERWPARYPIAIEEVPPEVQQQIPVGSTGYVVIVGYKLKEGRDRSKPYNWKWRFENVATEEEMQDYIQSHQNAAARPAQFPAISPQDQARQDSIHRQVALKAAVRHVGTASRQREITATTQQVTTAAEEFYYWLQNPPQGETTSAQEEGGQPDPYMEDFRMPLQPGEGPKPGPDDDRTERNTGGPQPTGDPNLI